jgi:hypothetical protein
MPRGRAARARRHRRRARAGRRHRRRRSRGPAAPGGQRAARGGRPRPRRARGTVTRHNPPAAGGAGRPQRGRRRPCLPPPPIHPPTPRDPRPTVRYGAPGRAPGGGAGGAAAAALVKAWYANPAATGSAPSLYQDDLLEGLVPEALPPAGGAPPRARPPPGPPGPRVHGGGAFGSPARAAGGGGGRRAQWQAAAAPQDAPGLAEGDAAAYAYALQQQQPYDPQQQKQQQPYQQQQAQAQAQRQAQQQAQQKQQQQAQQQRGPVPIANGDAAGGGAPAALGPPALGTWAHRQYKLPLPRGGGRPGALSPAQEVPEGGALGASLAQPIPGAWQPGDPAPFDGAAAAAAEAEAPAAAAAAAAAAEAGARGASEEEDEEEAVARAAWRWRFAKRWQAEQARGLDPAASAEGDGMEETLAYLAACGGQGWDLSRTMSDGLGGSSGSAPRMLGTMDSVGLLGQEALLVGESNSRHASFTGSPLGAAAAAAAAGGGGGGAGAPGGSRRGSATRPSLLGAAAARDSGGGGGRGSGAAGGAGAAGTAGGRGGAATRELTAATRRAKQLLATQSDLDRAADERWREAQAPPGGELWVGALLEAVEVDDWGKVRHAGGGWGGERGGTCRCTFILEWRGRLGDHPPRCTPTAQAPLSTPPRPRPPPAAPPQFKFVLVRLRDHAGRQKLFVRGRNYASEGKLLEGLHRQVLAAASAHGVPPEPVEPVGGGVAEWRRNRDRHLHLHSAYAAPRAGAPGGPMAPAEVLGLAGVLTKQSLPIHYRVTTEGGKAL